jgi:GH35 family endo-1,4-beta-xylanase
MGGIVSRCVLVTALGLCACANAWADVSTTTNGSALAERSYSNEFNGATQLNDFGQDSGNNAILTANGYVGTYVNLDQAGQLSFTVSASGTASGGIDPDMTISIADYHQSFDVTAGTNNYTYTSPVLPAGLYFVRTQLDNQQGTTIKPTLQVNSFTAASNNTVNVSVNNVDSNANALTAANTYINNFRQGTATALTGLSNGQSVSVKMLRNAFNFGTNITSATNSFIGSQNTTQQQQFQAYLNKHFNMIVTSNQGKWSSNEATQNVLTMSDVDEMYSYAKNNNMTARAHNLIWGTQQPNFINTDLSNALSSDPTTKANAIAALNTAISNRIGYYVSGGDTASTNPSSSPINQLVSRNTNSGAPGNTFDIRARDYKEMDVLNEPMNNSAYIKAIGYSGIASVYKQVQTAVNNVGANVGLFANEYNVIQNSKARYDPTTFASSGTDSYANWYAQYINQVNNSGQGNVISGAGIEWYQSGSVTSAATYQQVLQNLSVLGVPISIPEGGVNQTISPTNAVQAVDDVMRMLYGTPNGQTYMLWSTWGGATDVNFDSSSIMVGTVGNTTDWHLTAVGQRYEYLFGQNTDTTATAPQEQNNGGGVNLHPWNTADQTVSVNPNGSLNFSGAYGEYALQIGGVTYATVDFEKTGTTLWVKGDYNLDGKLTGADIQAALNALKNQNRVVSGSLVNGYQQTNNMSNEEYLAICDTNGDGLVNAQDIIGLEQLLASGIQAGNGIFGGGAFATVPEPASAVLAVLAFGLTACGVRRRRASGS